MRSAIVAGSALNWPAKTWFAPAIAALHGMPHAFAWNIGTIGRTVSCSVAPIALAWLTPKACRTIERWE
jgi:hypothetical protein